jgi:alanine racemase
VVGLVAGGYAQGVVREVGNRVAVRVGDHTAPIVGRVAMDACVVDLGDADASPGADVVFFGDPARHEPSLADWEAATGLRAAEIVSLAGARARRDDRP